MSISLSFVRRNLKLRIIHLNYLIKSFFLFSDTRRIFFHTFLVFVFSWGVGVISVQDKRRSMKLLLNNLFVLSLLLCQAASVWQKDGTPSETTLKKKGSMTSLEKLWLSLEMETHSPSTLHTCGRRRWRTHRP